RRHRVSLAVAAAPDLLAVLRIVRHDAARPGTHHLAAADHVDRERRRERELLRRRRLPIGLPAKFAGLRVEGRDELLVDAVGAEDDFAGFKDGCAAVAVNGAVLEVGVLPDDLPLEIETRGPHVAVMDEETVAVEDRRRAGVTVLLVRRGRALLLE